MVEFFVKTFRHDFFVKRFCSVFELPSLKNTRKCDKTKKVEEKLTSKFLSKFWDMFLTWTFCKKHFNGVFELPLPRNAQKRTKKKKSKKKSQGVGRWVWDLVKVRGGPSIFFLAAPRLGTIPRKTSDPTDKSNGQNLLGIAVTNALELLRGQNFEN